MTGWTTPDLCDDHHPDRVSVVQPGLLRGFGGREAFAGPVETVSCFEDNSRVKELGEQPGEGRVLVVDGGGSLRRALLGDLIAARYVENGWAGLVIHGAVRDVEVLRDLDLGPRVAGHATLVLLAASRRQDLQPLRAVPCARIHPPSMLQGLVGPVPHHLKVIVCGFLAPQARRAAACRTRVERTADAGRGPTQQPSRGAVLAASRRHRRPPCRERGGGAGRRCRRGAGPEPRPCDHGAARSRRARAGRRHRRGLRGGSGGEPQRRASRRTRRWRPCRRRPAPSRSGRSRPTVRRPVRRTWGGRRDRTRGRGGSTASGVASRPPGAAPRCPPAPRDQRSRATPRLR